ncbi:MAG: dephospho-CoA kinase [Prevotella sp.]|nr:dephospho-CoA kinase [Prevotella sp.]MCM1074195.1 dephospho-CoA kinase [Ruminococcus sp.]
MTIICVTGGIGSGKSVVCRICALKGVPVYDCDSKAKQLMQTDPELRAFLIDEIGPEAFNDAGVLNRQLLADKIFANDSVRRNVETQVHAAVRRDISAWVDALETQYRVAIIETAIPYKSSIDKIVDGIWAISAPEDVRIQRVQRRSALTSRQICDRMNAQRTEFASLPPENTDYINNDGLTPLLPEIYRLLSKY